MAKVLLVEDDNNLREIFELRLIAEGYTTITAGNGEEALVVAMKEKPDLIISDVMMPKLSGFEMLETLRAAPEMANVKTIMMTALGQAEDRAHGERLGVIKYLVKSQVTLEDFIKVVREVLAPEAGTPAATSTGAISGQTNVTSEGPMQEDANQNQPAADTGSVNPIADGGTGAAPAAPGQPSSADEQNAVQGQINNFVNSPPAETPAPAQDNGAPAGGATPQAASEDPTSAAPAPGSSADTSGSPVVQDQSAPADSAADTSAPAFPASTEPAQDAPQPPTETGSSDAAATPSDNTL